DELYLKAGKKFPQYKCYESFPQLENGVGMAVLFKNRFDRALALYKKKNNFPQKKTPLKIGVVTGTSAEHLLTDCIKKISGVSVNNFDVIVVKNNYFGHSITVSGLLTGGDILCGIKNENKIYDAIFLPENIFRAETDKPPFLMLDGATVFDLQKEFDKTVFIIGSLHGGTFCRQLINF
ncbi:MAG: DUF512 domain-containing protein, partial [Defluviitaleaceae bacterium]|nr:DUF512 domain-containing protein [Defluviitaleaceae bacterium]